MTTKITDKLHEEMTELGVVTEVNAGKTWYIVHDYRTGYADPRIAVKRQREYRSR